ncbi:hypothetical protein [Massilia sp. Leaf139]|uniref:hypothetical protein n=1 Tax=Massilia sp. Leaf139 TaxID=1736272 RepID=UPI0006F44943|nr:hypothetical protein [Massilia sp. Leaf139]KQQ96490.1 hypothetical protein ASF77_00335 [Massilia sp. Leaf139]
MYEAMQELFGYGHPGARFWVVGLEEHCGDAADIQGRIDLRTADPQRFLDVEAFHVELQGAMPAVERVSVWRIAREIYRGVYGADTEIGRLDPQRSDMLLSEILPLPRPQHNQWPEAYRGWFQDKDAYIEHARPIMVRRLIDMVDEHKPEVVILHGKTQHDTWIKNDPLIRVGWASEVVAGHRKQTLQWRCRNGTLWLRTNNLVTNGFVNFGATQIEQAVALIRRERVARPVADQ